MAQGLVPDFRMLQTKKHTGHERVTFRTLVTSVRLHAELPFPISQPSHGLRTERLVKLTFRMLHTKEHKGSRRGNCPDLGDLHIPTIDN